MVAGDTVTEVLNYVSYNKDDLVAQVRRFTEEALRAGSITLDESRSCCARTRTASPATRTWSARSTRRRRAMSGQQLRLVEKVEPGRSSTGT